MTRFSTRRGFVISVGIAAALLALSAVAFAGGRPMSTDLSGAEEVDAAGNPGAGDPDATGTANLTLNAGRERVCYELAWQNVEGTVHSAHIHEAPAGRNGGIVVSLFTNQSFPGTGSASGCDEGDATREEIRRILTNPAGFYVNVHSTVFPAGAIRGQLGD